MFCYLVAVFKYAEKKKYVEFMRQLFVTTAPPTYGE